MHSVSIAAAEPRPGGKSRLESEVAKERIFLPEKKLELEKNQLNQTRYKNKQLRDQINEYRLDKCAHKQSLSAIKDNLEKTSKAAEDQYEECVKENEQDSLQKEKIGLLRSKSASQRSKFDERITTLVSFLRSGNSKSRLMYEDKNYSMQGLEVLNVLKTMLKKCENTTLEKIRNKDHYIRHISNLANGFDQIRTATGVNDIEDIVTSCIKSEEQGLAILIYFNSLNSEIDNLEETLRLNNLRIETLTGSKLRGNLNVQEYLKKNENYYKSLQSKIKEKQEKITEINMTVQKALPILKKTYNLLEKMQFQSFISLKADVSAMDKLNQENTNYLLGQIEEFVNYLLMIEDYNNAHSFNYRSHEFRENNKKEEKLEIKEFLEDVDAYDEPELEDIKVPISLIEMKQKAQCIYEKRKNFLKGKSTTPDANQSRLSKHIGL